MPKQNLIKDLELSLAMLQAKRALKEPLPRYGRYLRRHALYKLNFMMGVKHAELVRPQ